ncbi:MAG: hypothetical protein V2A58_06340 [Planctomycetota bacterium]
MTANPLWLIGYLAPFGGLSAVVVLRVVKPRLRLTAAALWAIFTLVGALLLVNLAGRAVRDFDRALLISWIAALGACAAAILFLRARKDATGLEGLSPGTRAALLFATAGLTTAVGLLAWSTDFHDEIAVTGHLSVTNLIARGVYPPVYLPFPEVPYRYHYGFDALAAIFTRLGPMSAESAIDILSVVLFATLFLVAWATTFEMTGNVLAGWAAAGLCSMGGGLSFLFLPMKAFEGSILRAFTQEGARIFGAPVNPNMLSYFFQHPFALGLPVFLACVYLYVRLLREDRLALVPVLAVLLGVLALAQICLFVILACGLLAFPLVAAAARAFQPRKLLYYAAEIVLPGLALAGLSGGFFVRTTALETGLHVRQTPGFAGGSLWPNLAWMIASQGWTLLLLVPALVMAVRRRSDFALFAATLAVGALLPGHLFYYDRTWDIIKFFTVSYVAGALAAAWLLAQRPAKQRRARLTTVLAAVVIATAAAPGATFLVSRLYASSRVDRAAAGPVKDRLALTATDFEALDWLARHAGPRDTFFTEEPVAASASSYTGIPNPSPDNAYALGFPKGVILEREDDLFIALYETCFRRLAKMSVDWLYLSPASLPGPSATARANFDMYRRNGWLTVEEFGRDEDQRLVCHLAPPPDAPCLCNFHIDEYLRSLGARPDGDDLLADPANFPWQTPDGRNLPADRLVPQGRQRAIRVLRTPEGHILSAVARIDADGLLHSDACEISFWGRSPGPLMGQVDLLLLRDGASSRRLRAFRWVAHDGRTFSFFAALPSEAQGGELLIELSALDRGIPGEVFYRGVSLRPANLALEGNPDLRRLIGGD